MWLINTTTLRREEFINPEDYDIRYAILSHTWEEDEVSFQQFGDLDLARTISGFSKIEQTCELARSHGLQYAWVDTCCIDKSSSAELSEAINSMFTWYRNSAICYVYLSDLPDVPDMDLHRRDYSSMRRIEIEHDIYAAMFSSCRWFKRGWTLQELIAPKELIFHNADWVTMGSKDTLSHLLALVTGVDSDVLLGTVSLSSVSVCKRMSWAANRDTRRVEDIAYCLLGIFDVNLPLIYGEGYKAFQRLQEEILRTSDDMTILAWSSSKHVKEKYRPPLYRKTRERPRFRGAFAWAPAEFANARIAAPEIDSAFASPTKMNLVHGSVEISTGEGVPLNFEVYTSDLWLKIPGAENQLGRRLVMTPYGYAFADDDWGALRDNLTLRGVEVPQLRIISPQEAVRMEWSQHRHIHCLLRSSLEKMYNPSAMTYSWPAHRFDQVRCALTYSGPEVSAPDAPVLLLGMLVREAVIFIQSADSTGGCTNVNLNLLFCFGTIQNHAADKVEHPRQTWGVTFCKQSRSPTSSYIYQMVDSGERRDYMVRGAIESSLRDLLVDGNRKKSFQDFKDRRDVIEIRCTTNTSHYVRCYTEQTTENRPDNLETLHQFQIRFQKKTASGNWVDLDSDETLQDADALPASHVQAAQQATYTMAQTDPSNSQTALQQANFDALPAQI